MYYLSYLCEVNIDLSLKDCVWSSSVWLMMATFTPRRVFKSFISFRNSSLFNSVDKFRYYYYYFASWYQPDALIIYSQGHRSWGTRKAPSLRDRLTASSQQSGSSRCEFPSELLSIRPVAHPIYQQKSGNTSKDVHDSS